MHKTIENSRPSFASIYLTLVTITCSDSISAELELDSDYSATWDRAKLLDIDYQAKLYLLAAYILHMEMESAATRKSCVR